MTQHFRNDAIFLWRFLGYLYLCKSQYSSPVLRNRILGFLEKQIQLSCSYDIQITLQPGSRYEERSIEQGQNKRPSDPPLLAALSVAWLTFERKFFFIELVSISGGRKIVTFPFLLLGLPRT